MQSSPTSSCCLSLLFSTFLIFTLAEAALDLVSPPCWIVFLAHWPELPHTHTHPKELEVCLLLLLSIDFWRLGLSLGCLITGTLPNGKHQPPFASCQQFRLPGILWIIKRPHQKPVARCEFPVPVPVPVPVMIPFVISCGWATMILITLQWNSSFDWLSMERSVCAQLMRMLWVFPLQTAAITDVTVEAGVHLMAFSI